MYRTVLYVRQDPPHLKKEIVYRGDHENRQNRDPLHSIINCFYVSNYCYVSN